MKAGTNYEETTGREFGLFEETPGMRFIFHPDAPHFTIAAASKDMCAYFAVKREDLIGKGLFEAFPSNSSDPSDTGEAVMRSSFAHVLHYKVPDQLPMQRYDIKGTDGLFTKRYWKATSHPYLDAHGDVAYIIHSTEDVTDVVQADEMREKMKGLEQAHNVFLQAPVVIGIVRGKDYILELANEDALKLWAKTDAIIGKPLLEAIPEFKGQFAYEKIDEVFKTGQLFQATEVPITTIIDGKEETKYFDVYYKPYYDTGSTCVNGVFTLSNDVTEKVIVKKIKEESEDKYRALFQSMDQGFCVLEMIFDENDEPVDYLFLETNPVFERQTGIKDAVGKTARQLVPALEQHWFDLYGKVAKTGKALRFEEGSVAMGRWFQVYAYPSGGDGKKRVALLFTDTTEQKQRDERNRESEERFRTLADESPMFVFIVDADPLAPVSYWNKTWLNYTGQTAEDAFGRAWNGILHPEDLPVVMEYYVPAFENKEPYFIPSVRVKRHDGEFRWHAFKGNPRYLTTGEFNGYVGVGFDIHEQKQAEEALKKSEARTRLAVETAQLGTFEINVAAQTMIYSARAAEIFGLDDTIDWPYKAFSDRIHPEDAAIRHKALEVALQTGDLLYESRIVRADNTIRWIRVNGRLSDKESTANTLIGTVMDITEEKRAAELLEQKIEERTRELKQVNDQLKQFTYSASHDLQEPLRKISYFLDRLLQNLGPQLNDENKKIGERIQHTTARMRTLINDLLSYSNTTFGLTATEEVCLNEIVKDVLEDMEATFLEQQTKVNVHDLPDVKGDYRQLRQLFQNLISNAVKYRSKNKQPEVEISAQTLRGTEVVANIPEDIRSKLLYLITIKDNGIGFDPDDAETIFRLFHRLHGKAEYEGTGVGLAIVQKVVENHQGYIWAEGEPGEGARFNVLLPAE